MKKRIVFLLLLFALLLTACANADEQSPVTTASLTTVTTIPETTLSETQESTVPETEMPTHPLHSQFYIPGVSVENVITYFNEVCLDAEFVNSGDASLLQKWTEPIRYVLHGDYTEQDVATLSSFVAWLNTIEGFPGIAEATEEEIANLHIHICGQAEMTDLMGSQFIGMDGAVTFWYMDNEIYDAIICCRSDIDQTVRNSVILEELYNGLGPVQDTALRPDSIIYAEFSQPQSLTEMDELILKLLYHPQLLCGMDAAECEAVIRQLYY